MTYDDMTEGEQLRAEKFCNAAAEDAEPDPTEEDHDD